MDDQGPPPGPEDIHVLITSFGPFRTTATNPSALVASALSPTLPSCPHLPQTHLHTLPSPVHASYSTVLSTIPPLLFPPVTGSPRPNFNIVIFLGLAEKQHDFYCLETGARREGYDKPDGERQLPSRERLELWRKRWKAPEVLKVGFDVEDVLERWRGNLEEGEGKGRKGGGGGKQEGVGVDVRLSEDAGLYLCELTAYVGLVEYWRRGWGKGPVAFCHLPEGIEKRDVNRGVRVVEGLVRAVVESERATGRL